MKPALDLFSHLSSTGKDLAVTGMKLSCDNAEHKEPGWGKKASYLLGEFLLAQGYNKFLCEDFRKYCEVAQLTTPPSLRAYGGIILKAYKEGLIKNVGYGKVKNPKAHAANAAVWIKVK